jgi:predicted NBD/HSP70 family sugar kinase
VSFNYELGHLIGIEVGQRYTRVALSDLSHRVIATADIAHTRGEESEETANRIFATAEGLVLDSGIGSGRVVGVGVAMPNPVDDIHPTIDSLQIFPGWTGERVRIELEYRFKLPVFVENDANAHALAEYRWGAARGARSLIYIWTCGGLGSGIVLEGALYRGVAGSAGEIGHISVDPDGELCYCGNRGCLHTLVGGDAVVDRVRKVTGHELSAEDLAIAAAAGDRVPGGALRDAGRRIGRVLAQLANFINPDLIVVGGIFLPAGEVLLGPLREEVLGGAIAGASGVKVVASELGGAGSIRAVLAIVPLDLEALVGA